MPKWLFAAFFCLVQGGFLYGQEMPVRLGIDVLSDADFEILRGKKVALLTNLAGRNSGLRSSVELFSKAEACHLRAVLTPEHGYYGAIPAGQDVESVYDSSYKISFFSLYGKNRRPTREMLEGCTAVVVDLQDIGIRSYTFLSSLYNTMDACAEYRIPVYVLDRPNPLGGLSVDGNITESGYQSFVSIIPVPYVHGMTIGELAKMINGEAWLPKDNSGKSRVCSLTVIPMKRWQRKMSWESTKLLWTPTSPHIASVNSVRGAAATGFLGELSLVNTGVGTTLPFQYIGMPGMRSLEMLKILQNISPQNVWMSEVRFRPFYGKFSQKECNGLLLYFGPSPYLKPYSMGIEIMLALRKLHPDLFDDTKIQQPLKDMFMKVTGTDGIYQALVAGKSDTEIRDLSSRGLSKFIERRKKYLLYE